MRQRTRIERPKHENADVATAPHSISLLTAASSPSADPVHSGTERESPRAESGAFLGHSLGQMAISAPSPESPAGQSLPPELSSRFEQSLGTEFAAVRVHTDAASVALADSKHARAITVGNRIHFGAGQYRPDSPDGQGLLAHEAVHVAQQSRATRASPGLLGDPFEREAASLAPSVARGRSVRSSPAPSIAPAAQTATMEPPSLTSLNATVSGPPATAQPQAPQQQQPTGPADVNIGFNAMDIVHKLVIAIDASQVDMFKQKRHIDFGAVVAVLSNLTAGEATLVKEAYVKHEEGRSLEQDLLFKGESGFDPDLTLDQWMRLYRMIGGTRSIEGAPKDEADDAATRKRETEAIELHELLHGDLEKAQVERVMALLRRGVEANLALNMSYQKIYNVALTGEIARMGPTHLMRAMNLFMGLTVDADRLLVRSNQLRIEAIDKQIAELKDDGAIWSYAAITKLQKQRKELAGDIEQRTEESMAEGRSEVIKQGGDAQAVDAAMQSRASAVLGDAGSVAATVGGGDAAVIRAIASGDPVDKAAAELRKAESDDTLTAAQITSTLRGLREQAELRAKLENPKASPDELYAKGREMAAGFFSRLRSSYNLLMATTGGGMNLDQLLADKGDSDDAAVNRRLMESNGMLTDVEELVLALSGDRKDTETVERIFKYKSAAEIKLLKAQYTMQTLGRSLDHDLFGEAPTRAGEENPEAIGYYAKAQGKASGTSRLNLEDYLQRPEKEGGLEEANYVLARAEREYEYTIDNRGATGAWRDAWGNEQRKLLDESIAEVRAAHEEYMFGLMPNPKFPETGPAKKLLERMHLARATIRGDRAAYEKATAELRATFQAIAAFALQVALAAVIGPAVLELAALAEVGEGAAMGLRIAKIATEAAVGTASTIGSNLAVYGSDYSLERLKADLLGGMGGAIGPALLGPYAKALTAKLGPKLSAEIVQFSETVAGIETGAWAQGESGDLSPDALIKAAAMGKVSSAATKKIQGGLAIGEFAPGRGGGGSDTTATKPPAEATHPEQPAGTNGNGAPATPASETPTTKVPASTLPVVVPERVQGGGGGGNGSGGGGGAADGGGHDPFAGLTMAEVEAAVSAPGHSDLVLSAPAPGAPRHPSDASVAEIEAAVDGGARQAERRGRVEGQPANLSDDFRDLSAAEQAALLSENPGGVRPRPAPPAGGGARSPNPNDPMGMGVWEITTSAQSGRPGETRDVPTTIRVHTADPSPNLPADSNAATGNTVSVTQGNQSVTGTGVRMVPSVDAEGAGVPTWHRTAGATGDVMNASHIPIHRDPPHGSGGTPGTTPSTPTTGGAPDAKVAADLPEVVKSLPPEPDVSALANRPTPELHSPAPSVQAPGGKPTHAGAPEGTVHQHADPHNPVDAWKLYVEHITADPHREVALIYNQHLDQWAVVQGGRGKVATEAAMQELGWSKEDTILARHSHPVGVAGQTSEANQLPSGRGGDVQIVGEQSSKHREGAATDWHAIDIVGPGGKPDRTWLMHSAETGLWTVDFPDAGEFGGRGSKSFSSIDEYHDWFKERFGVSADVSTAAGGARALHSPDGGAPSSGGDGGGRGPAGHRGATGEGAGEEFSYEYHPETREPVVEHQRSRGQAAPEEARAGIAEERPRSPREEGEDIADVLSESTEGTATNSRSPSESEVLNTEQHAHEPWEPPAGATPAPPESASQAERIRWLNERFQMHVDAAIARFDAEGLTPNQARDVGQVVESGPERLDRLERTGVLGDSSPARDANARERAAGIAPPTREEAAVAATSDPGRYDMRRGSRIDQFAKESIARDPELAAIIAAPDFVAEPDLLDSIYPDWYDMTTRAQWTQHLLDYAPTHGPSPSGDLGFIDAGRR